jgi:hypothetical protein
MGDPTVNHRSNGQFAPGNKAAKGNPVNRRMMELRSHLIDAATPEKIKAVGDKLVELALAGDVSAARTWLDHVVGRAPQTVALTDADGGSVWNRDPEEDRATLMRILDACRLRRDAAQSPPEEV